MSILLTYDLANKHTEVKNELLSKLGYSAEWKDSNNRVHQLPNTTLFYTGNKTAQQVFTDLTDACSTHGVTLERGIAFSGNSWYGR